MIRTSHVGSFPLQHNIDNLRRIINDLYSLGLDVPPYPQLRNFIEIYLEPLVSSGIIEKKGDFYFGKKNRILDAEFPDPSIPEAEYMIKLLKTEGYDFKWIRGPVTGPFTLASRIYLEKDLTKGMASTSLTVKEIVEKFASYSRSFIEYLSKLGFDVLFIDEPVLGVIVGRRRILYGYQDSDIINIIDKVFEGIPGEHGIHVCGRISPKLFDLLTQVKNIDILNFEFYDTPKNIEIIEASKLINNGKKLAPGVVSAKKPQIESLEDVRELLLKINQKANGQIDLVSADCGFGGLSINNDREKAYRIGLEKLKIVIEAVKSLK